MNQKNGNNFAVLSFLENEYNRLVLLDDLFSKKLVTLKKYPQTEKLLIQETYKKNMLKDDVHEKLKYADSPLNKHFEQIFNSAFKQEKL